MQVRREGAREQLGRPAIGRSSNPTVESCGSRVAREPLRILAGNTLFFLASSQHTRTALFTAIDWIGWVGMDWLDWLKDGVVEIVEKVIKPHMIDD